MDYFEKIESSPYEDLYWNIPEKKQGAVNVIGGNGQSFRTEVKVAEYLAGNYPVETVNTVLPEVLKNKLPPVENFKFLPATEGGTFSGEGLADVINGADFNLIIGDLSKNAVTGKAVTSACEASEKPIVITRDTVDLIAENGPEKVLMNENMIIFGSLAQMQKILRAVYYPKMLLLSQSLVQVVEVLHKFTLSYPVGIVTLHNGQILVAKDGIVKAVPMEKSGYSPIMLWSGELAAKIVALNLYNPNSFIGATIAAILQIR
ncbi:hypothetical protein IJJ53_04125 [Candidatus Saccharibacteria bacterium]|nr:hypothetical protein [Candidatus Saccharibacteria bacterium]